MRGNQLLWISFSILLLLLLFGFTYSSGFAATGTPPGDENWDDNIGNPGTNGFVGSVTFSHTQIIAGGGYTQIGSTSAGIGGWDYVNWTSLNTNQNGVIYSLAYDPVNNLLYAGGSFTSLDGCTSGCNYIAKWDGSGWTGLGNGLNNAVLTMILDQTGNLYVGGSFTQTDSISTNHIAKWDGNNWSNMGDGVSGDVFALALDSSGTLYAGDNIGNLNYWNSSNSSWNSFITVSGGIFSLAFDSLDQLYIGGSFTDYGNNIVMWDGNGFQTLNGGTLDAVNAISVDSCDGVYIGTSGGSGASPIMYWDGTDWSGLGSGIDSSNGEYVQTLKYQNGLVAVGGYFSQSGGNAANNIALWTGVDCVKVNGLGRYTLYADNLPITITLTSWNENISKLRVQRYNRNHPSATAPLQNGFYWKIEALDSQGQPANGFELDLTMTAPFEPDQEDKLCHFNEITSSWSCSRSSFDAENHTLTINGVTSLSDWAIGNNAGPTVLELTQFNGNTSTHRLSAEMVGILVFSLICIIISVYIVKHRMLS